MDRHIGHLTQELEALGLRENTLVLFTGDNGTGRGAVEQAFDQRFKLYSTGKFFDLDHDVGEHSALRPEDLRGEAALAARKLQAALDQFKDARPAGLNSPQVPGEKRKKK